MDGPVLILDASRTEGLVALINGDQTITRTFSGNKGQAVKLTAFIPEVFEEAGLKPKDLETIVCGRGPGSFTGIRIALATAQGMASALSCNLIGLDAFQIQQAALLRLHPAKQLVKDYLILIDSKRADLFATCFTRKAENSEPPFLVNIDQLGEKFQDYIISGDALNREDVQAKAADFDTLPIFIEPQDYLKALCNVSDLSSDYLATPLYLRPPDVN